MPCLLTQLFPSVVVTAFFLSKGFQKTLQARIRDSFKIRLPDSVFPFCSVIFKFKLKNQLNWRPRCVATFVCILYCLLPLMRAIFKYWERKGIYVTISSPVAERKTAFSINVIFVILFQLIRCKSLLQKSVCVHRQSWTTVSIFLPFFFLFHAPSLCPLKALASSLVFPDLLSCCEYLACFS